MVYKNERERERVVRTEGTGKRRYHQGAKERMGGGEREGEGQKGEGRRSRRGEGRGRGRERKRRGGGEREELCY